MYSKKAVARFDAGRAFDIEDDVEFCPVVSEDEINLLRYGGSPPQMPGSAGYSSPSPVAGMPARHMATPSSSGYYTGSPVHHLTRTGVRMHYGGRGRHADTALSSYDIDRDTGVDYDAWSYANGQPGYAPSSGSAAYVNSSVPNAYYPSAPIASQPSYGAGSPARSYYPSAHPEAARGRNW